jgi:hypothetical protein
MRYKFLKDRVNFLLKVNPEATIKDVFSLQQYDRQKLVNNLQRHKEISYFEEKQFKAKLIAEQFNKSKL